MKPYLTRPERVCVGVVGFLLVTGAVLLFAFPPLRDQLVPQCSPATSGNCTAHVNSDPNVFAGILAGLGGAAILVAFLGIRFSSIKAGGVELVGKAFEDDTKGLTPVGKDTTAPGPARPVAGKAESTDVEAESAAFEPATLDQLLLVQNWGPEQRGIFLGHLVNPVPTQRRWEVAVFVTGSGDLDRVKAAEFYFGPGWRSKMFEGSRDRTGRLGCVVAAFTDFVAYCRVTFDDGHTFLLQHYCNIGGLETRPVVPQASHAS